MGMGMELGMGMGRDYVVLHPDDAWPGERREEKRKQAKRHSTANRNWTDIDKRCAAAGSNGDPSMVMQRVGPPVSVLVCSTCKYLVFSRRQGLDRTGFAATLFPDTVRASLVHTHRSITVDNSINEGASHKPLEHSLQN